MNIIDRVLNSLRIKDNLNVPDSHEDSDESQDKQYNVECWGCKTIIPFESNYCPKCGKPQHHNLIKNKYTTEGPILKEDHPISKKVPQKDKGMSEYELVRFATECNQLLKKQDWQEERNAGK